MRRGINGGGRQREGSRKQTYVTRRKSRRRGAPCPRTTRCYLRDPSDFFVSSPTSSPPPPPLAVTPGGSRRNITYKPHISNLLVNPWRSGSVCSSEREREREREREKMGDDAERRTHLDCRKKMLRRPVIFWRCMWAFLTVSSKKNRNTFSQRYDAPGMKEKSMGKVSRADFPRCRG